MNIRDSYIHGADGKGVVKSLYFATSAESVSKADFSDNYTTAAGKDLIFLLADTLGTKIGLPIPTLNQNTTGYASSLLTVKSTSTSNHYLTFVDSNNTTAEAENFYTSGDIYFKPSTGVLTVKSVTVSNTFNYSGIGSDTTSNAARKIWFASSSDGTPVVSDNFKYNPSTKTLTVDKISGPTIVIGNTTLYLDGANNVLTPDTVISNTSTDNTIPSSKAVWDAILTGMQANDAMVFKGFLTGGADIDHTAYTPGADRGDTYKVQTAGYINGEYYQVNDTFICTVDGTVAATSSNVNTVKANWGVVEGNGDYLNINGGTMYGTLSWDGTTALPTVNTASSILVVDDNVTKQIPLANLGTALGVANTWRNIYTGGTSRVGTATNTKAMNFVTTGNLSIAYLAAGTNSGQSGNTNYFTIQINAAENAVGVAGYVTAPTAADNKHNVWMTDANGVPAWRAVTIPNSTPTIGTSDTTIATIGGITINAKIGSYAAANHDHNYILGKDFYDKYSGYGALPPVFTPSLVMAEEGVPSSARCFVFNAFTTHDSLCNSIFWGGYGPFGVTELYSKYGNSGHLYYRVAKGWNSLYTDEWGGGHTLANLDDIPTKSSWNYDDRYIKLATELTSVTKTLKVDTWTTMVSINDLDAGTYAIQINSGNVYASGIFSTCHGTDSVIDEIPLHVADSGTNTWRPYARVSGNNLLMTTNETTGTSRQYTINIVKLI